MLLQIRKFFSRIKAYVLIRVWNMKFMKLRTKKIFN